MLGQAIDKNFPDLEALNAYYAGDFVLQMGFNRDGNHLVWVRKEILPVAAIDDGCKPALRVTFWNNALDWEDLALPAIQQLFEDAVKAQLKFQLEEVKGIQRIITRWVPEPSETSPAEVKPFEYSSEEAEKYDKEEGDPEDL